MKFVRLERGDEAVWGVVKEDRVFTLRQPPFEAISYDGESLALEQCTLLAPLSAHEDRLCGQELCGARPGDGWGTAGASDFVPEGAQHPEPPRGPVHAPDFVQRLDYEGELAIVIKKRAKDVKEENFSDYVLGYTCLNDVTARDIQRLDGQWTRGKGMDGFLPGGPLVVDDLDPSDLKVETRLNGEVRQSGRTSQVPARRTGIARIYYLRHDAGARGCGSHRTPAGIGPMLPGDTVEIEIEGIGVLRSRVI